MVVSFYDIRNLGVVERRNIINDKIEDIPKNVLLLSKIMGYLSDIFILDEYIFPIFLF